MISVFHFPSFFHISFSLTPFLSVSFSIDHSYCLLSDLSPLSLYSHFSNSLSLSLPPSIPSLTLLLPITPYHSLLLLHPIAPSLYSLSLPITPSLSHSLTPSLTPSYSLSLPLPLSPTSLF